MCNDFSFMKFWLNEIAIQIAALFFLWRAKHVDFKDYLFIENTCENKAKNNSIKTRGHSVILMLRNDPKK